MGLHVPFLDGINAECSVLCPIAYEKLQAARAGFEPTTPAFKCKRINHLTTELVEVNWWIQMGIAVGTTVHQSFTNQTNKGKTDWELSNFLKNWQRKLD